ncbi:histidine triad nucleotide-binding protein [Acidaminobacterium chupaoyuni]
MDCIFCKIVAGEIPSKCLYQDEKVYAFYDIQPAAPIHFLVVPKEHILSSAADVNADNSQIIAYIFEVIAKLARQLKLENGYRIVTNSGEDAGQTVHHLHFHVLAGKALGPMA